MALELLHHAPVNRYKEIKYLRGRYLLNSNHPQEMKKKMIKKKWLQEMIVGERSEVPTSIAKKKRNKKYKAPI